jgi:post-segregation antitoxin (ccd killing protein)
MAGDLFKGNHSSKNDASTRVKVNDWRKTVGITLPQNLMERARKHGLNISKVTEQALSSILDYMETQNHQKSSDFLNERSFPKESSVVPRAGFEPATTRSSASPSLQRQ